MAGEKKDKYVILDRDTRKVRVSNDVGGAQVLKPGSKKMNVPTDWKPWAYSAGGGVLSYLIAKSLMDDGDKKEPESVWMKVLRKAMPYAIGTAGALGGYALSKSGQDDSQKKNELALKVNDDGTVNEPDMPTGDLANGIGWGAFAGSGAAATRAALAHRYNVNSAANNFMAMGGKTVATTPSAGAVAPYNAGTAAKGMKAVEDIANRVALDPSMVGYRPGSELPKGAYLRKVMGQASAMHPTSVHGKVLNALGKPANGVWGKLLSAKGSLVSALGLLGLGAGARAWGKSQSDARKEVFDILNENGFEVKK